MATYSLDITIDNNKFGSIGNPYKMTHPTDIKSKFPNITKQVLEEYTAVYNSIDRDKSLLSNAGYGGVDIIISRDTFSLDLPYEKGIPQTYKFLGMNVNQDFQSVIPVGDGYVVVDEMFDRTKIKKVDDDGALRYVDKSMISTANDYIDKCNVEIIRKLATSLKTGALYDIIQKLQDRIEKNSSNDATVNVADLINIINIINEDLNTTVGLGYDPNIKSISLNLARVAEEDKQEALNKSNNSEGDNASVAAVVVIKCFVYWSEVIKKYSDYNRVLSAVDLWSNIVKKVIGSDAFNKDALTSFNTIDKQSGQFVGGTVAVVGVARNGSISDSDVVRSPVQYALVQLGNTISGRSNYVDINNLNDLMVGNVNIDAFDNPYDLTPSELQAVSNYDSLQNIDEDAKVCVSSYNLNDPEERGLFLKSAIKSYEKNFREYKPENNYDVTTAMSDLIERGESFKDILVPETEYSGDGSVVGYITTDTPEMIEIKLTKQNLLKVSKLIGKTLKPIYELF